ncbi:META domain-containing protein [Sphingobium sp.]|uniref:META domain-containing protein n=1 Tax=Sphingobium sp. TaxID=1912891 RepID=UPI002C082CA4|nr:META domain-containing protein [Sphingobium sp.]HUD94882.1 META domain-containing protein [Sphingobium sp.]
MRRLGFLFITLALLAGCSESGERSHLAQSAWRFDRIDGERPVSQASGITFDNGRIGIEVGCSSLGGPWRIDADRLVAGPLAQSETDCAAPSWHQGNAVSALLVATPRMTVDGNRMILQSSGHTAELVRTDDRD